MPQFRFKNSETGEVIIMPWNKKEKPTKADIEMFKQRRDAELVTPPPKLGMLDKPKAALYDLLSIPSKVITPPAPMAQEDVEKLPFTSTFGGFPIPGPRLTRKARELASGLVAPENVAITAATLPLGGLGAGIKQAIGPAVSGYFGVEMARHAPEAIQAAIQDPSFETVTDAAVLTAGALGAGKHAISGMKNLGTKPTPKEAKPASTALIRRPTSGQQGMQGTPPTGPQYIWEDSPRRVEWMEDLTTPPSAPIVPPQKLLAEGVPELPARVESPVRGPGFTMGAPKVIIPTTERPVEIGPPPKLESSTTKLAYGGGEGSRLVEQPTGFKVGPPPVAPKSPKINKENAANVEFKARNLEVPVVEIQAPSVSKAVKPAPEATSEVKPQVELPKPSGLTPIENEWIRQQPTDGLEVMRKGAKGKLAEELDIVLKERGIEQPPSIVEPPKSIGEGFTSNVEEGYSKAIAELDPTPNNLRMAAGRGKAAGKSRAQVIQDMIGAGANPKDASIAAARIYRPGEAGIFSPFAKAKKGALTSAEPNPEHAKADFSWLEQVIYEGLAAPDNAIEFFGNRTPAATELARLLKYQRTEGNRLSGVYDAALHESGLRQDRLSKLGGLTDEEIGNYRVQDSNGNVHIVIPRGAGGANEGKYVTRTADGVKPKEGYTLLDPLEGNLIDVLTENAMPGSPAIAKAAETARKVIKELSNRGAWKKVNPYEELQLRRDRATFFDSIRNETYKVATEEVIGKERARSPKIQGLLAEIENAGGDRKLVEAYIDRILSKQPVSPFADAEARAYNVVSRVLTAKYLPLFAVSNLATIGTLAMRGNVSRLIPALVNNLRVQDRMRASILRTGALSRYLTDELAPESTFGKLYGIRGSEQYLRSVSAEVGKGTARDLVEYLKKKQPGDFGYKAAYARLKNLTLKNDAQIAELMQRGKLTNKELDFAGGRMAEMTQGLTDAVDLPYAWTGKTGGLLLDYVFTYKRFAYASTKILFDAVKENPGKVLPMLAVLSPLIGETLGDTKAAIKGGLASTVTDESTADAVIREIENRGKYLERVSPFFKKYPLAARLVDDYLNSWAFGLLSDVMMAGMEGASGLAEFMTGPIVGLAGEIATSTKDTINDIYRGLSEGDWQTIEAWLQNYKNLTPGNLGSAVKRSADAPESQ